MDATPRAWSPPTAGRQIVKVHPLQRPGGRWTDPDDLPSEKTGYAMRDLDTLVRGVRRHGHHIGIYAERLLQVYRLLGLVRRHGRGPVETACAKGQDLDVVSKIASALEKATETTRSLGAARGVPDLHRRRPEAVFTVRTYATRPPYGPKTSAQIFTATATNTLVNGPGSPKPHDREPSRMSLSAAIRTASSISSVLAVASVVYP